MSTKITLQVLVRRFTDISLAAAVFKPHDRIMDINGWDHQLNRIESL